jgi:cell division protein FtsL
MKLIAIIIVIVISISIPAISYYQTNKRLNKIKKKIEEIKNKQKQP